MRRALLVLVFGCSSHASQRVEHPKCVPDERDVLVAEYEAEARLVIDQVTTIARHGYKAWSAHHVAADCPGDPAELFQYTDQPDVDRWGTLLRVECRVLSSHVVDVRVQSAGPDRTFDTNDDVLASRPHREGDSR